MTDSPSSSLLRALRDALDGRYQVERELGAGGMGQVYLGRDIALDRPVAIKVITPDLASSASSRERFLREARTVARLRHPNIVAVYAAGEVDGLLYFVMEYVHGESLRQKLEREGRVRGADAPAAVALLADLARALGYAHAQDVVHRDVKPENVLLDARTGRAMLTDFGLARAFSGDSGDGDSVVTRTGMVVGSPRYMSPEQAVGDRELDGRSDVYSLGLVGYEMFAGAAPFTGSTPMAVLTKQLMEAPVPLAERSPDVPTPIAHAIDRALSKLPEDRWPTGEAFADAMESATAPITSGGASSSGSAPTLSRVSLASGSAAGASPRARRALRWIAVVGGVALLLAVSLFARNQHGGAPRGVDPRKSFFVAPFEILGGGEQLAWLREGSASMLTLNLGQWSDLNVVGYERSLDLLREAGLDTARRIGLAEARAMARHAGVWTVVMGQVTPAGDSIQVTARLFDVATGKQVHQAAQSVANGADPRPLFDALTRRLLDLVGAPAMTLGRLTETTTGSVEAYRAYLDGSRALNRWQLDRADSLFALATARDSNFALAYYHRSMVLGWRQTGDSLHLWASRRAASLAGRLPPREREIVLGYADLTTALNAEARGDTIQPPASFRSAQSHYLAAIARDSGDAEAWYGLGDAYWHHRIDGWGGRETVGNWSRALRAFNRTLALDSTFYLAYSHKLDVYRQAAGQTPNLMLEGDSLHLLDADEARRPASVERLAASRRRAMVQAIGDARAWVQAAPAASAYTSLASLYHTTGHPDSAAAVLREAMRRPETHGPHTPFHLAYLQAMTDPPGATRILSEALRTTDAERLSAEGTGNLIEYLVGSGASAAVTGHLATVDSLTALALKAVRAPVALGLTEDPRIRLWNVGVRIASGLPTRATSADFGSALAVVERLPSPGGNFVRTHAVPTLYVSYLASPDPRTLSLLRAWRGAQAQHPELDALAALQVKDTAAAARAARLFPSADSVRQARVPISVVRWVGRARVYEGLGDLRAAVAAYAVIEPRFVSPQGQADPSWPLVARSQLWRGQLLERLDDRPASIAAYRRFLELWAGADPSLEPQRELARAGLRRLGAQA